MSTTDELLSRSDVTVVSINSHRARGKLATLLRVSTRDLPYFFSWDRGGEWAAIPAAYAEQASKITGITLAHKITDLNPCIDFNSPITTGQRLNALLTTTEASR